MTIQSEHHLQTGGDPRTLADYTRLHDEMSKLTHPARPDVDWLYAEKLCLSLFELNGIELQTVLPGIRLSAHSVPGCTA